MTERRFDATGALTFDLARGRVTAADGTPRVLVSAEALAKLVASASDDAARAFGRAIGEAIGRRVASRLGEGSDGSDVRAATVDEVIDHLGGELAVAGLGSLVVERWGSALVLVLEGAPLGGGVVFEALVEAAVGAAAGRAVRALVLTTAGRRVRVLVGGDAGVAKARAWLGDGVTWSEALGRLHGAAERGGA